MAFLPYKDYFGLSKVVWNSLDQVTKPPTCSVNDNVLGITCDLLPSTTRDPLFDWRSNADSDFARNGCEVALDEVDVFQTRLRGQVEVESNSKPADASEFLRKQTRKKKKVCVFCRNNGESSSVYQSHVLKDYLGRTTCPILRKYTCPTCGATGDKAHTIRYCPLYDGGLVAALGAL